ncbi:MAG: hypothetical protein ACLFN8_00360 [Candidatus Woesearchaeota archaeon]
MRKAQFAMEYMLVVAFSIVLMIPLVWYLYQGYDDLRGDVNVEHLVEVAREVSFQAEKLFYQGPGSRTIISAYFPQGVTKAHINRTGQNYGVIEFELEGFAGTIYSTIQASICDHVALPTFSGPHNIEIITNSSGCIIISENN